MKSRKPKLDQSHYNQMADRLGIILSNIDTHIIQHPTCKLNKKIDKSLKDKILFDIWSRKTLLLLELNNFDTLDVYADKAIAILSAEKLKHQ